jgi:hypothetical protein
MDKECFILADRTPEKRADSKKGQPSEDAAGDGKKRRPKRKRSTQQHSAASTEPDSANVHHDDVVPDAASQGPSDQNANPNANPKANKKKKPKHIKQVGRVTIFGDKFGLRLLARAKEISFDGTFEASPKPFGQLVAFHVRHHGVSRAVLFALLGNKEQATYSLLFNMVRELLSENDLSLHHKVNLITDYEESIAAAFLEVWPHATWQGCFAHFVRAVCQHIKNKKQHREFFTERRYQVAIRTIMALGFVPPEDREDYYKMVKEMFKDYAVVQEFLTTYFEPQWMYNKSGRRPLSSWNWFGRLHRTTNSVEAWHKNLNDEVSTI